MYYKLQNNTKMELDKLQNVIKIVFNAMIKRAIEKTIDQYLVGSEHKILFVWGPRRSGKTTLINKLAKQLKVVKFNFDLQSDREKFIAQRDILETLVKENKVILIDEVQNYPEATVVLKVLYDEFDVKIIATGSSELRQKSSKTFDTLAGRFNEIYCLPLSFNEIYEDERPKKSDLNNYFQGVAKKIQIFGSYPEVYLTEKQQEKEKIDLLQHILDAYVLKDTIDIYNLKNAKLAKDILIKIALQLGSEVSIREIANSFGASHSTVADYIEIFIKNYILIPLPSFKSNMRKAVSENRKLYFYDLGIRNILIQDFRDLDIRQDKGGVLENFIVSEMEKHRRVQNSKVNMYFYREYGGKEIDLVVEDYKKNYTTIEIKSTKGKVQQIFPLPNKSQMIGLTNYFEAINEILRGK